MSWDRVLNQQRVKEVLRRLVGQRRLAHAYLFSGPRGAGMDAMALELAKVVNCEQGGEEACDRCPDCLRAANLQHPNINIVVPLPPGKGEKAGDGPLEKLAAEDITALREEIALKSRNPYHTIAVPRATAIKVNSIRAIRKEVSLSTFGRGRKVFVLLDAEGMNDEASNALLKTLEEPPSGTLLILTTSQPEKLLPTIVSRCQHLRFARLADEEISRALVAAGGVAPAEAEIVASQAQGDYGRALQLLGSDVRERREEMVAFLRLAVQGARHDLVQFVDRFAASHDRTEVVDALSLLQSWLRNAMLLRTTGAGYDWADEPLRKFVARYRDVDYAEVHGAIERAISLVGKNVYIPLVLTTLAFSLEQNVDASRR